jgi:UDP-glucose 4-epimerase
MSESNGSAQSVLITGAAGFIGSGLVAALSERPGGLEHVIAMDVREVPEASRLPGIEYVVGDIRDPAIGKHMEQWSVDTVVHLAAIVTPGKDDTRDHEYSVDVLGTRNVLDQCLAHDVRKLVVTSSGAAYGYYADNPEWIVETDALRGNESFAYSDHKRLVEEMLAEAREQHPELGQLIFRPGTILGEHVANQITAIFERPVVLGVSGSDTPFVFIWDRDVVACIEKGIREDRTGIYNLAGDGAMPLAEIAEAVGKPYVVIPAAILKGALSILKPLGVSPYGPEQVDFLRYRPVLSNRALKEEFGYAPQLSTRGVFDLYWRSRGDG